MNCNLSRVLLAWHDNEERFTDFMRYLNDYDWDLKFSGEIVSTHIKYLDITLFNEGGRLLINNFFKKGNCDSIPKFNSCHLKKMSD